MFFAEKVVENPSILPNMEGTGAELIAPVVKKFLEHHGLGSQMSAGFIISDPKMLRVILAVCFVIYTAS